MKTATKIGLGLVVAYFIFARKGSASTGTQLATLVGSGMTGGVVPLSQTDSRWGAERVGNGGESKSIAKVGCVVTSVTMATNKLKGRSYVPPDMRPGGRAGLKSSDYIGAGLVIESAAQKLGLSCPESLRIRDSKRDSAGINNMKRKIEETLQKGGLAILRVDYDLSSPETNHTILCVATSPEGYVCIDPAGGKTIVLDDKLFIKRTASKTYACTGVAPIFNA